MKGAGPIIVIPTMTPEVDHWDPPPSPDPDYVPPDDESDQEQTPSYVPTLPQPSQHTPDDLNKSQEPEPEVKDKLGHQNGQRTCIKEEYSMKRAEIPMPQTKDYMESPGVPPPRGTLKFSHVGLGTNKGQRLLALYPEKPACAAVPLFVPARPEPEMSCSTPDPAPQGALLSARERLQARLQGNGDSKDSGEEVFYNDLLSELSLLKPNNIQLNLAGDGQGFRPCVSARGSRDSPRELQRSHSWGPDRGHTSGGRAQTSMSCSSRLGLHRLEAEPLGGARPTSHTALPEPEYLFSGRTLCMVQRHQRAFDMTQAARLGSGRQEDATRSSADYDSATACLRPRDHVRPTSYRDHWVAPASCKVSLKPTIMRLDRRKRMLMCALYNRAHRDPAS